jgi:Kef-type K+ transport system membrane component KefB
MALGHMSALSLTDHSAQGALPLAMLLVFGGAKLFDELFERLHQPGIVGQILAGVILGPSLLNWISPNELLDALAQLGVMFLLFRVGLEVKVSDLLEAGGTASLVAILGVILPFFAGWGLLSLFGEPRIESIFVGAAMVATSVGITAHVLAAKGLLQARASKIILAAAVIDDILGLLILAFVSSLGKGKVNVVQLSLTAALALGFTIVAATLGTRAVGHITPWLHRKMRGKEAQFATALVLMFTLSVLAVYAGVAAIIGAFLAGLALSGSMESRVHHLVRGVAELTVPFFLVGIGLHFNPATLGSSRAALLAILIVPLAAASKLLGCGLGALRLGSVDAVRVGVGMIPRGEVGMVVAQIGLSIGVVQQRIYDAVVFMAVATTLMAPPLLKAAYKSFSEES